ncbi:aldo/keto reductase [Kitasatospora sp. NPDC002040]|uniref:aldo/keto reductase n=1 Tax=Kitasatospora sp. NPDC002040 TaxID=3154661 RepID=UPI00331A5AA2
MTLSEQPLGSTGINLTRTGFGAWAIGGDGWRYGWGAQDDAASIAAIHHAVDAGINWIDTAAVYGLGHSEEVIGKALAALPPHARPHVFTKCGLVWDESDRSAAPHRIMKPASVRREVEASLRRLNTEQIDLYQVHYPDTGESLDWGGSAGEVSPNATPIEEYWQVLADLKTEGKVRAIGLSNHSVAELERAERIAHVDAIQPPFSAINRTAAAEIAWAKAHGTGVIAYSPMQSGLLTGAFSAERVAALPADDWRSGHPDFTSGLTANLRLADALRPVAERYGVGIGAVAVAWVLAWPGVTGAIVGARTPKQVAGWLPAAGLELTEQDLTEIAAAIEATGAGAGPTRA